MKSVYERAMGSEPTSAGGAMVPVEYANRIQRLVESFGVFAADAFQMPMSSDSLTFQRRTSGLSVFLTGENTAATASDMGFATINLNAKEWNCLAIYPKTLDADAAGAIGELVALEIAQSFAQQIDTSGFVGDGTSSDMQIVGLTTRLSSINGVDDGGGLVLATGATGAKWSGIVEDDINKLIGQLPTYRGIAPKFYCSNPFYWNVLTPIITAKGGVTMSEFRGTRQLSFAGYPVAITTVMPKTGGDSQIPLLFGDLKLSSTIGRRQALSPADIRQQRDSTLQPGSQADGSRRRGDAVHR